MVVFEESGGDPDGISIETVMRDNICTSVSPFYQQGDVKQWKSEPRLQQNFHDLKPEAVLKCDGRKIIKSIGFADFGNPTGACGEYVAGNCTNTLTRQIVEKVNLICVT